MDAAGAFCRDATRRREVGASRWLPPRCRDPVFTGTVGAVGRAVRLVASRCGLPCLLAAVRSQVGAWFRTTAFPLRASPAYPRWRTATRGVCGLFERGDVRVGRGALAVSEGVFDLGDAFPSEFFVGADRGFVLGHDV